MKKAPTAGLQAAVEGSSKTKLSTTETHASGLFVLLVALPTRPVFFTDTCTIHKINGSVNYCFANHGT